MQITRITSLYNRFRRRFFSNVHFARISLLLISLVVILLGWFILRQPTSRFLDNLQLLTGKPLPQTLGRTNLVLLGIGGQGHTGPNLADTIIFISIKLDTGQATLISIPRDLWVTSLRAKINTSYYYGFEKQATSGGLLLAKSAISESLGQPIHFAMVVDFSAFVRAIDILGGVDINIDRSFTDSLYPIPGKEEDPCNGDIETKCRYETVSFTAGPQHLDGNLALKYARSRHSADFEEGTDFARSVRQEKILSAVRSKLFSITNLKNSQIYRDLYILARESVITDISPEYYSTFFQLGLKMKKYPFIPKSIEDYLENPPVSSEYDMQWVLIPKGNNSRSLFDYISQLLD